LCHDDTGTVRQRGEQSPHWQGDTGILTPGASTVPHVIFELLGNSWQIMQVLLRRHASTHLHCTTPRLRRGARRQ